MSYSITLTNIPKATNPNARTHWAAKAKAVKRERTTAEMLWRSELGAMTGPKWARFGVTVEWQSPRRFIPDFDNAIARLKPTIDGAMDAAIVADDKGWLGTSMIPVVSKKRSVTITITPAEART